MNKALDAAALALCRYYDGLRPAHEQGLVMPDECDYGQAGEVLAAALPHIETELRAGIAAKLEVLQDEHFREYGADENGPRSYHRALSVAARVARGGAQ